MKHFRMALAIVMVFVSMVFVSLASAPTASAVEGCTSQVILKGDNWSNTVNWQEPSAGVPSIKHIRLSATTGYWFCPNGDRVNKIKVLWVEFCWSHLDGESLWFDGVKFNPYYFDDNNETNPPQIKVNDDGTIQNCKNLDIAGSQEVWMGMGASPGWTVSSWIVRVGWPDAHWDFRTNMSNTNSTVKYFHPAEDVNLGNWHW